MYFGLRGERCSFSLVGCCLSEGWIEDTALLVGTYVLSLLSFKVLLSFFDLCALLLYELEISL